MDPAGPVFDVEPEFAPKMRLYPGDAQFVDVIHTNGWDWIELGIGQKSGDVDFYVNGGGDQPGCDGAILVIYSFFVIIISTSFCYYYCYHYCYYHCYYNCY